MSVVSKRWKVTGCEICIHQPMIQNYIYTSELANEWIKLKHVPTINKFHASKDLKTLSFPDLPYNVN